MPLSFVVVQRTGFVDTMPRAVFLPCDIVGRVCILEFLFLPVAFFLSRPFDGEVVPERPQTYKEFLRVWMGRVENAPVLSYLEPLKEDKELGEGELPVNLMTEDEVCRRAYLIDGRVVVYPEECERVCDVESQPVERCLL